ncbi:hypothetical protein PLESTB_000858200 [Pleodorina starrii]|uniref:L-dopachrome isomerase n=1 Tax=Pleodorina starrii TaxID=330485 RepID=A0A9W6BLB9_9CHLO|nr:hypothetical protein PLESTB_000858200 [Pleodorina starrii]
MRVPGDRVPCVDVLKTLSQAVAKAVGKSEQVVMCSLATDRPMIFSGSTEPCAYGWFMSVGAIGGEKNKTISAAICEVLATQLSIPAARVYIEEPNQNTCSGCYRIYRHFGSSCPLVARRRP